MFYNLYQFSPNYFSRFILCGYWYELLLKPFFLIIRRNDQFLLFQHFCYTYSVPIIIKKVTSYVWLFIIKKHRKRGEKIAAPGCNSYLFHMLIFKDYKFLQNQKNPHCRLLNVLFLYYS